MTRFVLCGVKVKPATEHLHAEECKDNDEKEEKEQQRGDGLDGVKERRHEVGEWTPVPGSKRSIGCWREAEESLDKNMEEEEDEEEKAVLRDAGWKERRMGRYMEMDEEVLKGKCNKEWLT